MEQALADADLMSQSETFAKDLSGGQKRKLSVVIALIGEPKVTLHFMSFLPSVLLLTFKCKKYGIIHFYEYVLTFEMFCFNS